jgi:hypothetical protein
VPGAKAAASYVLCEAEASLDRRHGGGVDAVLDQLIAEILAATQAVAAFEQATAN